MKIEEEIQSKFKNDYHKLIVNLHLTYSRLTGPFQSQLKSFGITPTQYNVLRILRGQKQKPASIGLIKDRMIDRNSDASRVIDRLLKKGLIERRENKTDRRQRDVIIHENGLELLEKIEISEEKFISVFKDFPIEEIQRANDLLDAIRSAATENE